MYSDAVEKETVDIEPAQESRVAQIVSAEEYQPVDYFEVFDEKAFGYFHIVEVCEIGVDEVVFEGGRGEGMGCGGDIPARVARYLADDAVHSSCIGIIQGADALAESRLPSHIDNQQCCF